MNLTLKLGSMRSYAVAIVAGLLLLGGYSHKSEAAACGTGTYDNLLGTGFTCEIGDKTFSAFFLLSTDITAASVSYASVDGVGGFWGFDFQFAGLGGSGAGEGAPLVEDVAFGYTVACTDGSACIDSIHGAIVGAVANGGVVSMGETFNAGSGFGQAILPPSLGSSFFDEDFTPVSSLTISKDINANCEAPAGGEVDPLCFANVSFIRNYVDQVPPASSGPGASSGEPGGSSSGNGVPEPASLSLLAAGLMGLGLYRRRRNRV